MRFNPPGFLDDMTDAQKDAWSNKISGWLDRAQRGKPAINDGPRDQFFNALRHPPATDAQVAIISWNAFPRQVKNTSLSDKHRWRRADQSRDLQDEYCEWSVTKDPVSHKITRVTFTCEGPEYWQELAEVAPDKVLALYQQYVSSNVTRQDLFPGGVYNPFNRFNNSTTNGAMHLIQGANTLSAEIELAAAATIRRMVNGRELSDAQELIECSNYGEGSRNSDPHIGEQVNALARGKSDITLNDPVGLHFEGFNPVGWVTPDGTDARTFWQFVRGQEGHWVRAVYEVPPGRGYVVGDIKIGTRLIEFGGQIADFVTIKLEGLATRIGQSTVEAFSGCLGDNDASDAAPLEADSVTEGLRGRSALPPAADADMRGTEEELLRRLPEPLQARLVPSEEADGEADAVAADAHGLHYPKLPPEQFVPRLISGKMLAYASPDSTFAVTRDLLDSAQRSIVIGMYDFNADYVKEHLIRAMQRRVRVSLMLDTNSADEPGLFRELRRLGATCVQSPSSSAGSRFPYFGNAHEKIIVVDDEVVMIQSGNWSRNSIPFNEGDGVTVGMFMPGNRDMGLAVHSAELAVFFSGLIARDMRLAQGLPVDMDADEAGEADEAVGPSASEIFFEAAPPEAPSRLFSSLKVIPSTPVRITPAVTPENFQDTLKPLLRSARRNIRIEQQYIRGGQAAVEELLDAIDQARADHPSLDVRIIVSPKYLTDAQRKAFLKAMSKHGLEFDDHIRFLSAAHFVHCHNKLIVVDDEKVLLGSQNWSTTGLLSNREASLLVEHAGIAGYYAEIFDADWQMSEPTNADAETLFTDALAGIADAADFGAGGVVISSIADYVDV